MTEAGDNQIDVVGLEPMITGQVVTNFFDECPDVMVNDVLTDAQLMERHRLELPFGLDPIAVRKLLAQGSGA